MKTVSETAAEAAPIPVARIAEKLGIPESSLSVFNTYTAKVSAQLLNTLPERRSSLILVTAITPTRFGEGKTTVTIGLAQALAKLGKRAMLCIREPSLGPVFGIKGGATGGGRSQVLPADEINLHFTGDIHAVGSAHNLLSAIIDNHLQHGNRLKIDPRRVIWRRVMDMNDRSLREILVGLGGPRQGIPRQDGFDITVASEIMAILCLATGINDLQKRLRRMVVAYTYDSKPVYARDLNVTGAMTALLRNAINPNLVQSTEGVPAFVHGGPFANIAHGCSSLIATKLAMKLSDYVVTEAGFGADLGAEKFFDIKCRIGNLEPACAVLVVSIRALRLHGYSDDHSKPDTKAVRTGLPNMEKQIENLRLFGVPVVVAINRFSSDSDEEVKIVLSECKRLAVPAAEASLYENGGAGGLDLAGLVLSAEKQSGIRFLYHDETIMEKIDIVARRIYGASRVKYTPHAETQLKGLGKYKNLPVCIAKTQNSLSDNPKLLGRPKNFTVTVTDIIPSLGAGFLVVHTGNILTMPGLPEHPNAENITVGADGVINGL
ncbi:MAG: formate--tetrahydrofolate ligase [archaeon]